MSGIFSLFKKKEVRPICSAIIAAAGSASRMEGIDKILAPLGELPVLVHTLYAFQDCPVIDEIIVVTREELMIEVSRLCKEFSFTKVAKVLAGGSQRTQSVQIGIREVREDATLIAIHDGARPLVSGPIIEGAVHCAAQTGAAAPAIAVTDTIKQASDSLVETTLDRATLWAVQTPQVFQADLIRVALHKAQEDNATIYDDCGAVERLGMKVSLTAGSAENIKLTTPIDFLIGQAILAARVKGQLP